ncbi:MAG: hypothetical protein R3D99_02990 [Altererythrobacter sp.]
MRKSIIAAGAAAIAATLAFAGTPGTAQSDNAAFVVNQSSCSGTVNTPEGPITVATSDGAIQVLTSSGNAMFVCNLDVVAGPELKKAIKLEGFGCFTPGGPATESRLVITPGGKATAVCRRRD